MKYDSGIRIEECEKVYPPREDTFLLLEAISVVPGEKVLEMGCGTGIISLHCSKAGAYVTAVDVNPYAVSCARGNAALNGLELDVVHSDLFLDVEGSYDVMLFNPPYLPSEEKGEIEASWAGGEDGVKVLERFLIDAPSRLREGGRIYVLFSSMMLAPALTAVLTQYRRERLASKKLFYEELWVEKLTLPC